MKGHFFAIVGPSGVGKNTLISRYLEENKNASFPVSSTTRAIREGEVDGVDYIFLSKKKFKEKISKNEFLEWAEVFGNYYGTLRKTIMDSLDLGKILLKDIDVQGTLELMEKLNKSIFTTIFISPPSMKELEERLKGRGTDSEEVIHVRLSDARREMAAKEKFDYIIVNDDIEMAYDTLKKIIEEKLN